MNGYSDEEVLIDVKWDLRNEIGNPDGDGNRVFSGGFKELVEEILQQEDLPVIGNKSKIKKALNILVVKKALEIREDSVKIHLHLI